MPSSTITVVDRIAPAFRVGTRSDGATFLVGQHVAEDFACADEPNGSGVRSCAGPVATSAPLETSFPGQKTFRVTTTDGAGDTAAATRTDRVLAPPPPERLNFTLGFGFSRPNTSTRFTPCVPGSVGPCAQERS